MPPTKPFTLIPRSQMTAPGSQATGQPSNPPNTQLVPRDAGSLAGPLVADLKVALPLSRVWLWGPPKETSDLGEALAAGLECSCIRLNSAAPLAESGYEAAVQFSDDLDLGAPMVTVDTGFSEATWTRADCDLLLGSADTLIVEVSPFPAPAEAIPVDRAAYERFLKSRAYVHIRVHPTTENYAESIYKLAEVIYDRLQAGHSA